MNKLVESAFKNYAKNHAHQKRQKTSTPISIESGQSVRSERRQRSRSNDSIILMDKKQRPSPLISLESESDARKKKSRIRISSKETIEISSRSQSKRKNERRGRRHIRYTTQKIIEISESRSGSSWSRSPR